MSTEAANGTPETFGLGPPSCPGMTPVSPAVIPPPGGTDFPPSGSDRLLTYVSKVCPTGSSGVSVEFTTINLFTGAVISKVCVQNPTGCCSNSSGSSPPTGCPALCNGCNMPATLSAVVAGVEDGTCTNCVAVNGTHDLILRPIGHHDCISLGGCCWSSDAYDAGCGSSTGPIRLYFDGANWNLQMGIGASGGWPGVLVGGTWDCVGTNVFTIAHGSDPYCTGETVTVTITGVCEPELFAAPAFGAPGPDQQRSPPRGLKRFDREPCVHLGRETGDLARCDGCGETGKTAAVRTCSLHVLCTEKASSLPTTDPAVRRRLADCRGCPDYRPREQGWTMLLTGGIGDAAAVESLLSPSERETLTEICYACPAAAEISALFRGLPNYPRLKNHRVLPTGDATYQSAADVAAAVGPLPEGTRDFSISRVFPEGRPYSGSSLLTYRLADPAGPGVPYVVVAPHSTWGRWQGRDFDAADWDVCLSSLEAAGLLGLVLCRERLPLPSHHALLDWQGRTDVRRTVELLKGAQGYLGVDTGLSVLAGKLFPDSRLSVKSVWEHCYRWAKVYFAPRTDFAFLDRKLRRPTWE